MTTEPPDNAYVMVRRSTRVGGPNVQMWRREGNLWLCVSHPQPDGWYETWAVLVGRDVESAPVQMAAVQSATYEPGV